jgi:hypothetical protein
VAGTGLSGGTITTSGTISLATSGVSAGTYGSSTYSPVITVDSYGRITGVYESAISGGGGSNAYAYIYANGSPGASASSTGSIINFKGTGSTTVSYSYTGGYDTITINSTSSSGGSGLTWTESTSSYYQGSTSISYPSGITAGGYIFVAFVISGSMSSMDIQQPSYDPSSGVSWSNYSMGPFIIFYASVPSYSTAPSSQMWTFNNQGHFMYTSWVVAGATSQLISATSSSSSGSVFLSSGYTKKHTFLFATNAPTPDMTTATITVPSGWTSTGTKKHSNNSQLTVASYQNATATTGTLNFSASTSFNTYYYASVATM